MMVRAQMTELRPLDAGIVGRKGMKAAKGLAGKVALVSALIGAASFFVAAPASAHGTSWTKLRSDCKYTGGMASDDLYAWTEKWYGSCTGHAWLYTRTYSGVYWEGHAATFISHSAPSYDRFRVDGHKSQSGESYAYYYH